MFPPPPNITGQVGARGPPLLPQCPVPADRHQEGPADGPRHEAAAGPREAVHRHP